MSSRRLVAVLLLAAACAPAGAEPEPPQLPSPFPTTTTTAPPCRNSYEPSCGEFRYDPQPANQEMRVEVSFAPPSPRAGEEVTFTVKVSDDGPAHPGCLNYQQYGEDDEEYRYCTAGCVEDRPRRYGPWDPPPPENSSFTEEFRHTYAKPRDYTARFVYNAGDDCSRSPYRSRGSAEVKVPVSSGGSPRTPASSGGSPRTPARPAG